MRILPPQEPEKNPIPTSTAKAEVSATTTVAQPPTLDSGRIDTLENISSSILQKLRNIDERIKNLENAQKAPIRPVVVETAPAAEPVVPQPKPEPLAKPVVAPVPQAPEMDADAIRRGLLTKMWKYLNDQAAA